MNAHDLCLIIDNDRDFLRGWLQAASRKGWNADQAEEYALAACAVTRQPWHGMVSRFCAEVASLAFARIDWSEVAEHYAGKVREGVTV